MDSTIKDKITSQVKEAMRSGDTRRRDALRLVTAAIKQIEVDERIAVDDARCLAILDKMLKQRRDSLEMYKQAARQDLIDQEQYEMDIIHEFMPQQLSEAEIDELITGAVAKAGGASMQNMGKIMAELKPKLQGRADIAAVSAKVKALLG